MAPKTKIAWGGQWTEEKLEAFEDYVKAYLVIMNKAKARYGFQTIYFDGFAGSGSRSNQDIEKEVSSMLDLFGDEVQAEDLSVYRGAAERVVRLGTEPEDSFDRYYFVEKSQENCDALQGKLSQYQTNGKLFFVPNDANSAVKGLAKILRQDSKQRALAFLDPFGMQIDWSTIEALKGLHADLWILVPTGVIVNRLLERNYDPDKGFIHAEKLESFFGMESGEILDAFYEQHSEPSLFGDEQTLITKTTDPIKKIAQLYVRRLKDTGIFKCVTDNPLVLYNTHNLPIYHFVFASQNETALKIAQYIINKKK